MAYDPLDGVQDRMDSILKAFEAGVGNAIERAKLDVLADLNARLSVEEGKVVQTATNLRILRGLDTMFLSALDRAGFNAVVENFTDSFAGQLPLFQDVLASINRTLTNPLPPLNWSRTDLAAFGAMQDVTQSQLEGELETAAAAVKRDALFSVNGMSARELNYALAAGFARSAPSLNALAETALPTFYRTVSARGFDRIEETLAPGSVLLFTYHGPLDKLNRPFCRRTMEMARAGRTWTKTQILKMNNGGRLPVLTCAGGFRCRHVWALAGIRK
jgi:hypothetical protein